MQLRFLQGSGISSNHQEELDALINKYPSNVQVFCYFNWLYVIGCLHNENSAHESVPMMYCFDSLVSIVEFNIVVWGGDYASGMVRKPCFFPYCQLCQNYPTRSSNLAETMDRRPEACVRGQLQYGLAFPDTGELSSLQSNIRCPHTQKSNPLSIVGERDGGCCY